MNTNTLKEKELTISQAGRQGGFARAEKHTDKIPSWGKKGGDTTSRRYGPEHYRRIGKMGAIKKKLIKEHAPFAEGQCRKCGIRMDGDLAYLQSPKDPTLCSTCV